MDVFMENIYLFQKRLHNLALDKLSKQVNFGFWDFEREIT